MPLTENILVPTHDRRHIGKIREGKISHECWSKANLAEIPVDYDAMIESPVDLTKLEGGRKVKDAEEELRKGGQEGSDRDAEAVRKKEGRAGILREGKQVRAGKKSPEEGKQHLQKGRAFKAKAKQKVEQKPKEHGRAKKGRRG
jgi:hypothetical protein